MNFTGCKIFLPMVTYFFTPAVKILKIETPVDLGLLIAMVKLDFPNDAKKKRYLEKYPAYPNGII